jgi:hypothetical protein
MRDFNYTVNVLVKAYLNNTLRHEECKACAVGNIAGSDLWKYLFVTADPGVQTRLPTWYRPTIDGFKTMQDARLAGMKIIKKTGYTWKELAMVELAFESAPKGNSKDDHMFNGLMAVVDVLAEIHNINLEEIKEAKALFVKTF